MNFHKYSYYAGSILKMLNGMRPWHLILPIFLGLPVPEKKIVLLPRRGLRFQVRGKMDVWSIKETFLDRFYEKFGVPIQDGWLIVDIGAGIGEYTLFATAGHQNNTVHAYEPFPESFSLLTDNLKLNGMQGVTAFMEAVGSQSGTASLDLSSAEPLQFSISAQVTSPANLHVPVVTLAQVLDRVGKRVNVLKLDCEGAEYAILFSASQEVLDAIDHIVLEVHDGVTDYSRQDLAKFLREKGFSVRLVTNSVHPELGYMYACRFPLPTP